MKTYYESHESAYQQIKSKGFIGWGNVKTLNELGDKRTNEYLTSLVTQFYPTTQSQKALDVGCGTGTTAFVLSKLGFSVTGIDISETAIQMGRDLAKQQNLDIRFVTDDLLKIKNLHENFDLIYDSHCLHCIVFDEDRKKAFSEIKKLLNPSGLFVLDTMVMPPDENFDFTGGVESLRLRHIKGLFNPNPRYPRPAPGDLSSFPHINPYVTRPPRHRGLCLLVK